jgi:hypothetical protein
MMDLQGSMQVCAVHSVPCPLHRAGNTRLVAEPRDTNLPDIATSLAGRPHGGIERPELPHLRPVGARAPRICTNICRPSRPTTLSVSTQYTLLMLLAKKSSAIPARKNDFVWSGVHVLNS